MGYDSKVFSKVFGVSAGAVMASFYLAGKEQSYKGYSIFTEECCSKQFFDITRRKNKLDIDYLINNVLSEGDKKLDVKRVSESPSEFYVGAATQTGNLEFINAKEAEPNLLTAVKASMAMPRFYNGKVVVNGHEYHDPVNDWVPIKKIIGTFGKSELTDLLVITNRSERSLTSLNEQIIAALATGAARTPWGHNFMHIRDNPGNSAEIRAAKHNLHMNVGFLHASEDAAKGIGTFTQDKQKLSQAGLLSAKHTCEIFGESATDVKI